MNCLSTSTPLLAAVSGNMTSWSPQRPASSEGEPALSSDSRPNKWSCSKTNSRSNSNTTSTSRLLAHSLFLSAPTRSNKLSQYGARRMFSLNCSWITSLTSEKFGPGNCTRYRIFCFYFFFLFLYLYFLYIKGPCEAKRCWLERKWWPRVQRANFITER